MESLLEELEGVLKDELDIHDSLLESANSFNAAIREEDLNKIDCQRAIHDKIACRLEKLEEQRTECCLSLAGKLGIEKRPLKMAMLIEKVPFQWKERLGLLHQKLKEKVKDLNKISISNRLLLEEGLRMVEHTFSMMNCAGSRYMAYGSRGQTVASAATKNLFNKTI